MAVLASTLRRCLLVPAVAPTLLVACAAAWLASTLVTANLGAHEPFLADIRQGSLLFAGLLLLSLAEPLEVGRDARDGLLLLRAQRGRGFALVGRWLGLLLATLPVVLLTAPAAGGAPTDPVALLAALAVLAAGGLLLGSLLGRGRLVPALWALAVAGHIRPWLAAHDAGRALAWLLPDLTALHGARGLGHAALWIAAALLLAHARLARVAARGRPA